MTSKPKFEDSEAMKMPGAKFEMSECIRCGYTRASCTFFQSPLNKKEKVCLVCYREEKVIVERLLP